MVTFDIRRTRIAVDASGFSGLTDALTGEPPINWKGNASQYEVGFFWGLIDGVLTLDNQIVDVSDFQSITMEVKLSQGTPENVIAKTLVTADFNAITVTTWNDKSAQHCTFSFTDIESNVPAAEYYLVFSGITASGNVVTLGAGQLTIREDGTPQEADDPAPNPGAAISLAQADARYAQIGVTSQAPKYIYSASVISDGHFITNNAAPAPTTSITLADEVLGDATDWALISPGTNIIFCGSDGFPIRFTITAITADGSGNPIIAVTAVNVNTSTWEGSYSIFFIPSITIGFTGTDASGTYLNGLRTA